MALILQILQNFGKLDAKDFNFEFSMPLVLG